MLSSILVISIFVSSILPKTKVFCTTGSIERLSKMTKLYGNLWRCSMGFRFIRFKAGFCLFISLFGWLFSSWANLSLSSSNWSPNFWKISKYFIWQITHSIFNRCNLLFFYVLNECYEFLQNVSFVIRQGKTS